MKMGKISLLLTVAILAANAGAFPVISNPAGAVLAAKNRGTQQDSVNNLKQIGVAISMYALSNDEKLPESFSDLEEYAGGSRIFIAAFDKKSKQAVTGQEIKANNTSFAYVGNLGRMTALNNPAMTPLAFEKPWLLPESQQSITVLFADGHVERFSIPQVADKSCRDVVKIITAKLQNKALKEQLQKNAAKEDSARKNAEK